MQFRLRIFGDHGPEWGVAFLALLPLGALAFRFVDLQDTRNSALYRPYVDGGPVLFTYIALAVLWTFVQIALIRRRGELAYGTLWITPLVLGPALLMGPMLAACQHMNFCI
ncbi:MAG: hypothetical protein BGN86_16015 [Caulobacterales bacterium 68-7]|nr:MAG: hypothetical protein BGN86_16015 [Caulobacterales bacterium 68-7]